MTTKTLYIANDGVAFDNEAQCRAHEAVEDAKDAEIENLRSSILETNAEINSLKSTSKICVTLSRLTQDFIAKRDEYKRVLKRTDFSIKSMIALDKTLHAACEAYEKWDAAVRRLNELREQFAVSRKKWHDEGYGLRRY